ncbi:MAG: dihydrofolate reductase [Litorimonas sp.]
MIPRTPLLSAIVARSRNGVIGRDGDLPWRLGSDLKHFKRLTLGKPCVMGRKTWASLPGALPGRPNLVLTRDGDYKANGAEVFTDLRALIGRAAEHAAETETGEIMVIGGAEVYRLLMPWTGRVYETIVDVELSGDAHFELADAADWTERDRVSHRAGPRDDHAFVTRTLDRRLRTLEA